MSRQRENATKVASMVNDFGFKPEEFCECMTTEHRTLQQNFTRLCLEWIKTCARDDYRHDERNRASHVKCKAIVDAMSNDPAWDFIPYI